MVFYIKGGMQAKGIRKQDPEANVWAKRVADGNGENSTMRKFIGCTVRLIK